MARAPQSFTPSCFRQQTRSRLSIRYSPEKRGSYTLTSCFLSISGTLLVLNESKTVTCAPEPWETTQWAPKWWICSIDWLFRHDNESCARITVSKSPEIDGNAVAIKYWNILITLSSSHSQFRIAFLSLWVRVIWFMVTHLPSSLFSSSTESLTVSQTSSFSCSPLLPNRSEPRCLGFPYSLFGRGTTFLRISFFGGFQLTGGHDLWGFCSMILLKENQWMFQALWGSPHLSISKRNLAVSLSFVYNCVLGRFFLFFSVVGALLQNLWILMECTILLTHCPPLVLFQESSSLYQGQEGGCVCKRDLVFPNFIHSEKKKSHTCACKAWSVFSSLYSYMTECFRTRWQCTFFQVLFHCLHQIYLMNYF